MSATVSKPAPSSPTALLMVQPPTETVGPLTNRSVGLTPCMGNGGGREHLERAAECSSR